jgi:CheY-like chemotaxis protein
MTYQLAGCSVLVVEYEAIIALHIARLLESAGARVVTTRSPETALTLIERDRWSAAVLDHKLGDADGSPICEALTERDIPFVLYTGHEPDSSVCDDGVVVLKPVSSAVLVQTVEELVKADHRPAAS